ncbi:MAG: hypothetical protein WCJ87_07190 [Burkholderiales bacterium]
MATRFDISRLQAISQLPNAGGAEWLVEAENSVEFLKVNAQSEEVVIYAIGPATLIHAVLAPLQQVTPADQEDLLRCFVQIDESWVIQKSYGGGEGHRVYLQAPLSSQCKSLAGGEKLIFRRSFDGVQEGESPIELSQKLVHALSVHFVPERNAYCRLDQRGDIEDVIRIIRLGEGSGRESLTAVTILTKDLSTYMTLADMAVVFIFDFTRFKPGSFNGWGDHPRIQHREPDLFYNGGSDGNASYVNGRMVVRSTVPLEQLIEEWKEGSNPTKREYATFKIFDRKNNVEVETSCGPEFLSNYFQKSSLPWEISPAFFRPDVLHRFKADPEKYSLDDRSISCRNAWYLTTYDINEAGQVHTYVGYLADLPIEEQRYWQSFNEWPKGTISKRAHENDITGEFSSEYDPLQVLKYKIRKLNEVPPSWWLARSEEHLDAARYPATDSPLEWANEILAFDQLLVEGFQVKPLRKVLEAKGKTAESSWASLRVIVELLIASGQGVDDAKAVVAPLSKLHALRSILKAHSSVSEKNKEEHLARSTNGTLRAHYKHLAGECDKAFDSILLALGIGDLNP